MKTTMTSASGNHPKPLLHVHSDIKQIQDDVKINLAVFSLLEKWLSHGSIMKILVRQASNLQAPHHVEAPCVAKSDGCCLKMWVYPKTGYVLPNG
jgi:hypothetical protein